MVKYKDCKTPVKFGVFLSGVRKIAKSVWQIHAYSTLNIAATKRSNSTFLQSSRDGDDDAGQCSSRAQCSTQQVHPTLLSPPSHKPVHSKEPGEAEPTATHQSPRLANAAHGVPESRPRLAASPGHGLTRAAVSGAYAISAASGDLERTG